MKVYLFIYYKSIVATTPLDFRIFALSESVMVIGRSAVSNVPVLCLTSIGAILLPMRPTDVTGRALL